MFRDSLILIIKSIEAHCSFLLVSYIAITLARISSVFKENVNNGKSKHCISTTKITVRIWIEYRQDCIVVYVNRNVLFHLAFFIRKITCLNKQNYSVELIFLTF